MASKEKDEAMRVTRSQTNSLVKVTTPEDEPKEDLSNVEQNNVKPGKRSRRLKTEKDAQPAKRAMRFTSIQNDHSNGAMKNFSNAQEKTVVQTPKRVRSSKNETVKNDNKQCTISDMIATSCKLTNEMLDMKKQLFDKTNKLLQLQQEHLQLVIKYNELVVVAERLTEENEDLRRQRFCDDLIDLNPNQTSGTEKAVKSVGNENFLELCPENGLVDLLNEHFNDSTELLQPKGLEESRTTNSGSTTQPSIQEHTNDSTELLQSKELEESRTTNSGSTTEPRIEEHTNDSTESLQSKELEESRTTNSGSTTEPSIEEHTNDSTESLPMHHSSTNFTWTPIE